MNGPFSGLLVPALTPFTAALDPDSDRYVRSIESLLERGADGIAMFGTTGEANSMTLAERRILLEAVRRSGIEGRRLMIGVGSCSMTEAAQAISHAADMEAAGALLLPPFFYKTSVVNDDGLFDFVAEVIRRTAGATTKIYLYHIPQVAVIGWSIDLVRRLAEAFPERIVGMKDSAGDWEHTKHLIETFPQLDIFSGFEVDLLKGLRCGGLGCVTATGNINVTGVKAVINDHQSDQADALQQQATKIRTAVQNAGPAISVMKAYIALKTGDQQWTRVRPPLRPASREIAESLDEALTLLGHECEIA